MRSSFTCTLSESVARWPKIVVVINVPGLASATVMPPPAIAVMRPRLRTSLRKKLICLLLIWRGRLDVRRQLRAVGQEIAGDYDQLSGAAVERLQGLTRSLGEAIPHLVALDHAVAVQGDLALENRDHAGSAVAVLGRLGTRGEVELLLDQAVGAADARRVEGEGVERLVGCRRSRRPRDGQRRLRAMRDRVGDHRHRVYRAHVHGLHGLVEGL